MSGRDVLNGLSDSAFLANVDDRDRDSGRVAGSVVAGVVAGLTASVVATVLMLGAYAVSSGAMAHGPQGISAA